jgi:hypothetical protein
MDFILPHKAGLDDKLYCEDKPSGDGCTKDNKKFKFLCETLPQVPVILRRVLEIPHYRQLSV